MPLIAVVSKGVVLRVSNNLVEVFALFDCYCATDGAKSCKRCKYSHFVLFGYKLIDQKSEAFLNEIKNTLLLRNAAVKAVLN